MTRALRLGALLLLASVVAACTAEAPAVVATGASASSTVASAPGAGAEPGTDRGNGRPGVTYDGLMVRRRVVIAILPAPGADVDSLRQALDRAAASARTTLSDISPSVLDPADQERLAPDVTVVLPAGSTPADAGKLIDPATSTVAAFPDVQDYLVAPVLVHDLRFTVSASNPAVMAAAIAREGILTDALGSYSTSSSSGTLEITYTGPLLSDDLVELVRRAVARGEGVRPSSVTVAPRSTTGVGVDMAKEPAPAPEVEDVSAPHGHGAALLATQPVAGESSQSSPATVAVLAVAASLIVTLVMLLRRKTKPRD